jgi:hypothetical protein
MCLATPDLQMAIIIGKTPLTRQRPPWTVVGSALHMGAFCKTTSLAQLSSPKSLIFIGCPVAVLEFCKRLMVVDTCCLRNPTSQITRQSSSKQFTHDQYPFPRSFCSISIHQSWD